MIKVDKLEPGEVEVHFATKSIADQLAHCIRGMFVHGLDHAHLGNDWPTVTKLSESPSASVESPLPKPINSSTEHLGLEMFLIDARGVDTSLLGKIVEWYCVDIIGLDRCEYWVYLTKKAADSKVKYG